MTSVGVAATVARYRPSWEAHGLTVVVVHDVTEEPSAFQVAHSLALSRREFHQLVEWIARTYNIITADDLDRSSDVGPNACLITIDDGFEGALTHGASLMSDLQIPAVFFLNAGVAQGELNVCAEAEFMNDRLGELSPWGSGFRPHLDVEPNRLAEARCLLDRDGINDEVVAFQGRFASMRQIKYWDGHPTFRFGNHLWNHWSTLGLPPEELRSQYASNAQVLCGLRGSIPWFAATSGRADSTRVELLQRCGATRVFCGSGPPNLSRSTLVYYRIDLGSGPSTSLGWKGTAVATPIIRRHNRISA